MTEEHEGKELLKSGSEKVVDALKKLGPNCVYVVRDGNVLVYGPPGNFGPTMYSAEDVDKAFREKLLKKVTVSEASSGKLRQFEGYAVCE